MSINYEKCEDMKKGKRCVRNYDHLIDSKDVLRYLTDANWEHKIAEVE
jgi:hypothetical protein